MRTSFWTRYKDIALPVLGAGLALVGGVMGARYQLPLDVQLEQQKTLLELRRGAYADFFEGQARSRILRIYNQETPEDQENRIRVARSKFFVAVFGSRAAVDAMADYFQKYVNPEPCVGPRDQYANDVRMYREMRRELFGDEGEQPSDTTMAALLFDCVL